jgi:hypothetical protein
MSRHVITALTAAALLGLATAATPVAAQQGRAGGHAGPSGGQFGGHAGPSFGGQMGGRVGPSPGGQFGGAVAPRMNLGPNVGPRVGQGPGFPRYAYRPGPYYDRHGHRHFRRGFPYGFAFGYPWYAYNDYYPYYAYDSCWTYRRVLINGVWRLRRVWVCY